MHADISAVSNPNTGVAVYDPNGPNGGGWEIYGGTSAATPIVAAAFMLAGRPAQNSYPFRRMYTSGSLYDVTSGSTGSCSGSYLCTAGSGYDGPTGLGTPAGTGALAPDVIAVGAGTRNSCALRADGKLSCWGFDGLGQADAPTGNYVALASSDDHSCAIDTAGALHCWGNNAGGMATPPAGTYVAVSAGPNDTCAIDTAGALHCWGDNSSGQTSVPGGAYAAVTVGAQHACAIDRRGAVTCWGDSSSGKTTVPSGVYSTISAGANHTCGLRSSGGLICWGDNSSGQTAGSAGVPPFGPWMDVASGTSGSCGLDIEGHASCWGDNSQGQNSPPTSVSSRVALGQYHGCVYGAAGVTCWGQNTDGRATPLFATSSLPQGLTGASYSADVALSSTVVPAVSFTVASGSLPPGIALSAAGHLSGTPTTLGTYNFTVRASNGIAPAATASLSIQVVALPGAPTAVVAMRGNGEALVSWTAPASGGGTITGYTVTASSGGFQCTTTATSCIVSGLTNGQSYTFTVTATNGVGTGAPSSPSNAVTPSQAGGVTVSSASPRLGQGAANRQVKINGSGFLTGSTVSFSGTGIVGKSVVVVSSILITTQVSVASNASLGAADVTVTVPGSGAATCTGCFVVNPGPTVSSVAPSSVARGQAVPVDIIGTTFNTGVTVTISTTDVTVGPVTRVDPTHLRVTLTAASTAVVGARSLTITNTDAGKVTVANVVTIT